MTYYTKARDIEQDRRVFLSLLRYAGNIVGVHSRVMRGELGAYALVYPDKVLVVNKGISILHNIGHVVRFDKKALDYAHKYSKALWVYVGDSSRFYSFKTRDLINNYVHFDKENSMVTFRINQGLRV